MALGLRTLGALCVIALGLCLPVVGLVLGGLDAQDRCSLGKCDNSYLWRYVIVGGLLILGGLVLLWWARRRKPV